MKKSMPSGQVAVMLMIIIMMLIIITTTAVAVAFSTFKDTTTLSLGERALMVAESGAENALLRLLRDPNYSGEPAPLSIGPGNATITVSSSNPLVITSTGKVGNMVRRVQIEADITNGQLSVISWQEL